MNPCDLIRLIGAVLVFALIGLIGSCAPAHATNNCWGYYASGTKCPPVVMHMNSANAPQQGEAGNGDTIALPQSQAGSASYNVPAGSTPTSPNDGDCWNDDGTHALAAGLYCRIGGVTYGPYNKAITSLVNGTNVTISCTSSPPIACTINASGGGGGSGGGLFSGRITGVPTISSTGMTTWINQRGSTITNAKNGVILSSPSTGGSSTNYSEYCAPAPTAPYTWTTLIQPPTSSAGQFAFGGVSLHNSSNGGDLAMTLQNNSGSPGFINNMNLQSSSSPTTGTNIASVPWVRSFLWVVLQDDGTSLKVYTSYDGDQLWQQYSMSRTSGVFSTGAPNELCMIVNPFNGAMSIEIAAWSFTQP